MSSDSYTAPTKSITALEPGWVLTVIPQNANGQDLTHQGRLLGYRVSSAVTELMVNSNGSLFFVPVEGFPVHIEYDMEQFMRLQEKCGL
jgi:hypothetical protein